MLKRALHDAPLRRVARAWRGVPGSACVKARTPLCRFRCSVREGLGGVERQMEALRRSEALRTSINSVVRV